MKSKEPKTTFGLTATERRIIELRFGREGLRIGGPMDEAGIRSRYRTAKLCGRSRTWVRYHEMRAREALYAPLEDMERRGMLAPRRRIVKARSGGGAADLECGHHVGPVGTPIPLSVRCLPCQRGRLRQIRKATVKRGYCEGYLHELDRHVPELMEAT